MHPVVSKLSLETLYYESKDVKSPQWNEIILTKNLATSSAAVIGVYTLLSTRPIVVPQERISSAIRLKRCLRAGSENCAALERIQFELHCEYLM